jgi:uncharacterized membrane protein YoaK (UPF0700 family)
MADVDVVRSVSVPARRLIWTLLVADPRHGPLPLMLLTLTFVGGIMDAVSILQLGHVFVGNMTGNLAFMGFALGGGSGFSVSAPLLALALYVVGAWAGGIADRHFGHDRAVLLRTGTVTELVLLSAALAVAAVADEPFRGVILHVLVALGALAMGVQNAVAARLAVLDSGFTMLTTTLTRLFADLPSEGPGWASRIRGSFLVVALFAGAAVGAVLVLHAGAAAALGVAVAMLGGVSVAVASAARRPAGWRSA